MNAKAIDNRARNRNRACRENSR